VLACEIGGVGSNLALALCGWPTLRHPDAARERAEAERAADRSGRRKTGEERSTGDSESERESFEACQGAALCNEPHRRGRSEAGPREPAQDYVLVGVN